MIGNSKRAVAAWEIGESMPTAEFLTRFELAGLDLLYALTGRRGGNLSDDESALVDLYRRVPTDKRSALRVTAEALAIGAPAPSSKSHQVHQVFHGQVGHVQTVHDGNLTNRYAAADDKKRSRRGK